MSLCDFVTVPELQAEREGKRERERERESSRAFGEQNPQRSQTPALTRGCALARGGSGRTLPGSSVPGEREREREREGETV